MKVITNRCYGGFSLSLEALNLTYKLQGKKLYFFVSNGYGDDAEYAPIKLVEIIDNEDAYSSVYAYTSPTREDDSFVSPHMISRENTYAIQAIEQLGEKANGRCAELRIVDLPDGCEYSLEEYDGQEWIAETWFTVTKKQLVDGLSPELIESMSEVSCIRLAETED